MPRYKTKYVMAIDPSMASTGYAIIKVETLKDKIKKLTVTDYGTIKTQSKCKPQARVNDMTCELHQLLYKYSPRYILVEDFNIGFDRKIGGKVVNRKSLQLYSYASGAIYAYVLLWCMNDKGIHMLNTVPLTAPKKKMAQLLCKQLGVEKNVTTHEAECIVWAVNFCKTTKLD